jgi:plastocyanin
VISLLIVLTVARASANPPNTPADVRAITADEGASAPSEVGGPTAVVKMGDDMPMYQPDSIIIRAGQTVEWVNNGSVSHSVVDDPAKADKPNDVALPPGAKTFASGNVMPGAKYRYTFLTPGTYRYFCMSHEIDSMVGEVIVQPPTPEEAARMASQLRAQPWRMKEHPEREATVAGAILNPPAAPPPVRTASAARAATASQPAAARVTTATQTGSTDEMPPIPSEVSGPTAIVKMTDDAPIYWPNSVVIRVGQTVEWRNAGSVSHSVIDDPAKANNPEDVALPAGAKAFTSGNVTPGGRYRHTFLTPGTYHYFGASHEAGSMIGEVVVEPPTPEEAARMASQLRAQPWRVNEHPEPDSDR